MGNPKGFMEVDRKAGGYRPVAERVRDYSEVEQPLVVKDRQDQASRCMDCGIPFCIWGCPVANTMPEWQHAIYKGDWEKAYKILNKTNNFPEFTGKICPAPCEHACVLNIDEEPVTIRENEKDVAEMAFQLGLVKPNPPKKRTGKKVAVIGSGPAGMAAADLLNKWGHTVTLYEKDDAVGGLLRYGIPDFKLNKKIIDRRIDVMTAEGLNIKTNTMVGKDVKGKELLKEYDAVCMTIGAMKPRDLPVEGRDLNGIHFAMDFLTQQNQLVRGIKVPEKDILSAKGKNVIVIGGGDTGSDCVGTSARHGAISITQIEILPEPPDKRTLNNPWPYWSQVKRSSSSHQEGCKRYWSLATKRFIGDENGHVKEIEVVEVEWEQKDGKWIMNEKKDSSQIMKADLVLLAMGFVHPVHEGLADELGLEYDQRGNIKINDYQTNNKKVFAAGDAAMGASLVVRAIADGRKAAEKIDDHLKSK